MGKVKLKKPNNPKERNLIKGSLRRVFSRSELREEALQKTRIEHIDANRPRVTKWSWCPECGLIEPTYLMEVDHVEPLIPLNSSLDEMDWNEVVDRLWCDISNLNPVCKPCHHGKSALETKERKRLKKERLK